MGFLDPPGILGDGSYSGRSLPANGVMTYYSNNENGSWEETCVLPESQHDSCTTILNNFVQVYWSD